jgi:hypothetical protein
MSRKKPLGEEHHPFSSSTADILVTGVLVLRPHSP